MEEINLYDLLRFYAKKWLTIATIVMVGAIAGIIYTYYIQTPKYTSQAQLILVGNTRSTATDSVVLNNYVQLFKSHRVLDPVIADQNYKQGYDALAADVVATNAKSTDIINVSIATPDSKMSKALLEGAIQSFRTQAKALYGDNNIKINVVDAASTPSGASNVKPAVQIGLAIAASLALAIIGLFFVYDYKSSQRSRQSQAVEVVVPQKSKHKKAKKISRAVSSMIVGDDTSSDKKSDNK